MLGSKFDRITNERLNSNSIIEFLEYRHKLLTEGNGNICSTVFPPSRAPFYSDAYPYKSIIGSLSVYPWSTLTEVEPKTLVHPNPLELSNIRKNNHAPAYRCWDSAIAIPACQMRALHRRNQTPKIRQINKHWLDTAKAAFSRVGPLGPLGRIVRPEGRFIWDLKNMGTFGWTILELAHVITHLRSESKPSTNKINRINKFASDFASCILEVCYCIQYDLPINVTDRSGQTPGMADTYYGVKLKATTKIDSPVMNIPIVGNNALKVDDTLAVMLGAVLIEPVPYAYVSDTDMSGITDIWCGLPSLVALVGWEGVDYITHAPLVEYNNKAHYSLDGDDLLPPDSHWDYLAIAKSSLATPKIGPGCDWRYIHEFLKSDEYKKLRAETPGLPCSQCYAVNLKTEGAPRTPKTPHPEGDKKYWPKAWKDYYLELDKCVEIGKKAVESFEPIYYSEIDYLPKLDNKKRLAANRKRNKLKNSLFRQAKKLEIAIARAEGLDPKPMTDAQIKIYEEYKRKSKNE